MINFKIGFDMFFIPVYSLAMAGTALAALIGFAIEDPKLG